jgi:hypothetical protein
LHISKIFSRVVVAAILDNNHNNNVIPGMVVVISNTNNIIMPNKLLREAVHPAATWTTIRIREGGNPLGCSTPLNVHLPHLAIMHCQVQVQIPPTSPMSKCMNITTIRLFTVPNRRNLQITSFLGIMEENDH